MKTSNISTLLLLTLALLSLSVEAGRQRISDEQKSDVYSEPDIQKELEFGRNMAAQLLADYELIEDMKLLRYINLVGNVVLQNSSRQEIKYNFGVIQSDEINAYATPGGYIFITTAALDQMQSEAELAAVLAHEVAHVVLRHIVKVLKIRSGEESSTHIMGKLVSGGSSTAGALFDQAMGKAFDILFSTGLKIEDEFDADKLGLLLTAMAGYDINGYFEYLERISPLINAKDQQITRTHPSINKRIKQLKMNYQDEGLLSIVGYKNINRFKQNENME